MLSRTYRIGDKLRRKGAKDTHAALLQLSKNREGGLRLVTTNFECIFKQVAEQNNRIKSFWQNHVT